MKKIALFALVGILLWSCSSSDNGELVGVTDRQIFEDIDLRGMVFVEQGSFTMGVGDQDLTYSQTAQPRTVQVSSFWMDNTEITNNEYRQFVHWVRDSVAREFIVANTDVDQAMEAGYITKMETDLGEPDDENYVHNRGTQLPWTEGTEEEREALNNMYLKEKDRYYRRKELDTRLFNYVYYWIDLKSATQKREYGRKVEEEQKGAAFANRPSPGEPKDGSYAHLDSKIKGYWGKNERYIKKEVINVYPDTLSWIHDYAYAYNEDYVKNYFNSPAYDNYPVVGVSWKQAKAFCNWRTNYLNYYLEEVGYCTMQDFRLPTEAEWEYAARGGIKASPYPWGGPYSRNMSGCFIANYKPLRGGYDDDGGPCTLMVGHYAPNDFGLYDMAGNVSEWCEDAFEESIYNYGHDFRQGNFYNATDDDLQVMKRKVVRGGSWKDVKFYMQNQARTYEYQDSGKCYIGFRCVQSYLGRIKGDNLRSASNIKE